MLNHGLIQKEYAFLGDVIYTDTCQIGMPPLRTQQAAEGYMPAFVRATLRDEDFDYGGSRGHVRAQLARLVGGRADEIALTKNTTEGVSILASGYPLQKGDNIVTCDLENPSNLYPWFNAAQSRGFEVRVVQTKNGAIPAADIEAAMDEHTKIVALSAVQAGTGYFADLAALSAAAHRRGAILAVDAIQALGRMHIDVVKDGIDYLACGGYKGLMGGFGIGFLWCARPLQAQIAPPYAGPQSTAGFVMPPDVIPNADGFALRADAQRFEAGTHNAQGVALLESSLSLLLELGTPNIQRHILALEATLREALQGAALEVYTPAPRHHSGVLAATYPPEKFGAVEKALRAANIRLTHRAGYLRLAISFYNTQEQMHTIAQTLKEAL